jgi:hypothetical protein
MHYFRQLLSLNFCYKNNLNMNFACSRSNILWIQPKSYSPGKILCTRSEVSTAVSVNSTTLSYVASCTLVEIYILSEERIASIFRILILKRKAVRSSRNVSIFPTHYTELHPKYCIINNFTWLVSLEDNMSNVGAKARTDRQTDMTRHDNCAFI